MKWIEKYLVLGEGDWYGQPVKLRTDQKRFLYRWYEYCGRCWYWRYDEALRGAATGDGEVPYIALEVSKDHGHSWSDPLTVEAGRIGEYRWRVLWRRLGRGRDWIFRFTTDAPVPITLLDAYADVGKGA